MPASGDITASHSEFVPPGRAAETWLHRALLLVVALAALPLGSNRPLPAAALALAVGLLMALWGLLAATSALRVRVGPARLIWPLALYGAVCLWILLQWLPGVPAPFADPAWREASRILGMEVAGRMSVDPEATLTGLMHLLTYAGVFWLSLQLLREPERARSALRAVALIGALYALYGLVVFFAGNEWILIYRKWAYRDTLTSTFVNRNSYATFAGLTLLCAVALLLDRIRHLLALSRPLRIKFVLLVEELTARGWWITIAVLSISMALVLTASRAGVTASMIGLLCLLAAYLMRRAINRTQLLVISALLAGIAGMTFFISGDRLAERASALEGGGNFGPRGEVYALTIDAIQSSPWTGTGFGTFADVFPAYRGGDMPPQVLWDKAHNTYLENALELGVPAALILDLSILLLVFRAVRGVLERQREKVLPAIGVAASVIVGLHSLVDFSLQIPAVSVLYAFLLGMSVSQSWGSRPSSPS